MGAGLRGGGRRGDQDLADGAAGATFNPRDGQDDGGGPAADGQGAEAALVGRHLPAGVLDPVELADPGQHRHPAQDLGRFLGIEPLRPDDPVPPTRILFVSKATSPYNRRVEPRRALKRLLGRQDRSLVTKASRSTKKDFLKYDLSESGAEAIRRRLKMDPGRFCRVAEGVTVHESRVTSVEASVEPRSDFSDASVDPTEARNALVPSQPIGVDGGTARALPELPSHPARPRDRPKT
jgi:hypothetical protein